MLRVVSAAAAALLLLSAPAHAAGKDAYQLTLVFADSYLGGRYPVALFHDRDSCDRKGGAKATEFGNYGHPASYVCAKVAPSGPKDAVHMPTHVDYDKYMRDLPPQ